MMSLTNLSLSASDFAPSAAVVVLEVASPVSIAVAVTPTRRPDTTSSLSSGARAFNTFAITALTFGATRNNALS